MYDICFMLFLSSGITYDISNKHRLGYSEVQLVQCMIDGVRSIHAQYSRIQTSWGLGPEITEITSSELNFSSKLAIRSSFPGQHSCHGGPGTPEEARHRLKRLINVGLKDF